MIIRSAIKLKPRKCKQCGEVFTPLTPLGYLCGVKCALERTRFLAKKKEDRDWNEEKKIMIAKIMALTEHEKLAKAVFQKWVRLRDEKLSCISCGVSQTEIWDGGHFLKSELYSGLIFNEDNCHKQCRKCNHFLGGNELNYREGLIKRIGEAKVLELEASKDRLRVYHFTKDQLFEIKEKYKQKIKELTGK